MPKGFFLDARLPLLHRDGHGASFGSPWLGARHVHRASRLLWLDLGLNVGIPVPAAEDFPSWYWLTDLVHYLQGGWDTQRFLPQTLMFRTHATFDFSTKPVLFRIEVVQTLTLDLIERSRGMADVGGSPDTTDLWHQLALAVQSQGLAGGGFRIQVAMPLGPPVVSSELYGFVETGSFFARLGLMASMSPGHSIRLEYLDANVSFSMGTRFR